MAVHSGLMLASNNLELVKVLGNFWNSFLESLALTDSRDTLSNLSSTVNSSIHGFPMVKRALREGLSTSIGTKISSEAKRFHNREVSQQCHLGSSGPLLLREDVTTTLGEHTVHVTHGILWDRDVTQVDRLKDVWLSSQQRCEANTTGGRHDLTHTTMDGISMEDNIHEVEPASTHLFLTKRTVLGGPGETADNRLLNFEEVVHTLGGVNEKIGSSALRSKGPNLTGLSDIPAKFIRHLTALGLRLVTGGNFTIINRKTEFSTNSSSLHKETVVLVGRLGKTGLVRLAGTCLTEGDDGIRDLDLSSHKVLLKILEANLQVQLTRGGNNVLSRLLGVTQNHWVRLGQTLHTLDKLGQISRVLGLNGTTDDGGDRELHCLNGVAIFSSDDGTRLEEVLIHSNQSTSVSSGDIRNLLSVTSHHDTSTLDVLDPKIGLLSRNVVRSQNADLLSSGNGSREDTSECVETSLIRCGDHLGHIHTKWCAL
mmetsp:Transcript_25046/g.53989  ORF Transcript_25046/g.53989 Transcript_25046/m.53989 type:complete len:483 (+) Transcript_25046:135-1583(+)